MTTKLARLARMDGRELWWRSRVAARVALDRARASAREPRWQRARLARAIDSAPDLSPARRAIEQGRWLDAHRSLLAHVASSPARFPIAPGMRALVAQRIRARFPGAADDAVARSNRSVRGEYDLLGYTGLRFGSDDIDWHLDPVHRRTPPRAFWSAVPFLDPDCGDHKVIWELNRHQHWLTLGRAFWLTDDRTYRDLVSTQLSSWLAANPPLMGVNWASMLELSFRSISWMWALHFLAEDEARDRTPWAVDMALALEEHLTQIERNLSYYFSPNTHLLGEALALYIGGVTLPWLGDAERRAAVGRRVLLAEIGRQIAADGGHCERSTHYHRYALDLYLLALIVARINRDPAAADFTSAVERLGVAARALADDHGRVPHFGDDDGGSVFRFAGRMPDDLTDSLEVAAALTGRLDLRVGAPTEEAAWLLAHPEFDSARERLEEDSSAPAPSSTALRDTGYFVSRTRGVHLVMDAGAHGYQNGGHAHADALSLTLTIGSQPLLIDPGTHCYTVRPELRDSMRSTALHNTLLLDERPASVPQGPFHWSHTANCTVHRWRSNDAFDYLDASHDGYAPVVHRRRVLSLRGDLIVVADLVSGSGVHRADVHWHIDPRWTISCKGADVTASSGDSRIQLVIPAGTVECFTADSQTGLGWHAPVYGALEPSTTLRVTRIEKAPFWIVTIIGLRPEHAIEHAAVEPIWSAAGALEHGIALKITRACSIERIVMAEPREPATGVLWRACGIETDAAMAICRSDRDDPDAASAVGVVDASHVRGLGHLAVAIDLPVRVQDMHIDGGSPDAVHGRPHVRDRRVR